MHDLAFVRVRGLSVQLDSAMVALGFQKPGHSLSNHGHSHGLSGPSAVDAIIDDGTVTRTFQHSICTDLSTDNQAQSSPQPPPRFVIMVYMVHYNVAIFYFVSLSHIKSPDFLRIRVTLEFCTSPWK